MIFDLDNTLYEYEVCNVNAMSCISKIVSNKFKISESNFINYYEKARLQVKKRLTGSASSHSRLLYIKEAFEYMKIGSQIETIIELEQAYWNKYLEKAVLFSGVYEFLKILKDRGIVLTCLTNLNTFIQLKKIYYLNLEKVFDYIITSEEIGLEKPNKMCFILAQNKMKLSGEEIWMIGDDLVADISGAKNSINSTTILRTKNNINSFEQPSVDAYFFDYNKLNNLFDKINKSYV